MMQNKKDLVFEYKGYKAICKWKKGRYWGTFYSPEAPDVALEDWKFAADTSEEAGKRTCSKVEKILERKMFQEKQEEWKKSVDYQSIGAVFDILPEIFAERIDSGHFDTRLLQGVEGGDYVVPLYYVTKAWDVLLRGSLGIIAFMIGPEEDEEDDYEKALKEFMEEERATRTRCEACKQNDVMKSIWKDKLNIDIDALDIDFTQFNMHIPPNVSDKEYYNYFLDVPEGIQEWILGGINHPDMQHCTFDTVSSLMEFTAMIKLGLCDY